MTKGNSNIAAYGADTQFGKERGPDPSAAATKKNKEAHTQTVRGALRRIAISDFDITKPLTQEQIAKVFGRQGTVISGAQAFAVRKFQAAMQKADSRLMQQVTDDIDGKQVQPTVEAKVTLADLLAASYDKDILEGSIEE